MTTRATPSNAASVLQRLPFSTYLLPAGLAVAVALAGCHVLHSGFDIAVGNRTANSVSIFANGGKVGEVGSNGTATFTVDATPTPQTTTSSGGSSIAPTTTAQVTFSAQDLTTGALSGGVSATLVQNVTTYVDVAPCVLIGVITGGPAPPCVTVSSSTPPSPGPVCTLSLSASNQSFNATGGTGTVNVTTSNGCTWGATSSQTWLTIVSGASGTGNGVVTYLVAANSTGQARTATLTIGTQTFTVNQTA